jgi:hypothetical protein
VFHLKIGRVRVAVVNCKKLEKWIKKHRVGRNAAIATADFFDPATKRYEKYFNVANLTPKAFLDLAVQLKMRVDRAFAAVGMDGSLPARLPQQLKIVSDNYACWRMMRGERDLALRTRGLESKVAEKLKRISL